MQIQALSAENSDQWQAIALEASESWFWHTPAWLEFVRAVGAEQLVGDHSFLIVRDRVPLAICPLIIELREGYRRFSYLGEFVPFPACRLGLDETARAKVIATYVDHLDALAAQYSVDYARVIVPTLSELSQGGGARWNPLLRHGFLDISGASQVVSLAPDRDALWQDVRKGHRSDVKRAAAHCAVTVWDHSTVTETKFDEYRTLHAIDAGRVTRGGVTFDIMLSWIRAGHAVLVEARRDDASVAFAVIIVYRTGAYYASSCKQPDLDVPAMHLVQWETICWLKAHGVARYDLGMQPIAPTWCHVPSAKDESIAHFKRGFGGTTCRVDVVERFYSVSVMERVGQARLNALLASRAGALLKRDER